MSAYTTINTDHITQLKKIVGENQLTNNKEVLEEYGHDETESLIYPPEVLIKPSSVEEVSKVMSYASKHRIPVTPIGARTGLSGGALSILSLIHI